MLLNGEWKCILIKAGDVPQTFSAAVPGVYIQI